MITFNNLSSEAPYLILKEKYDQALFADQKIIEAMSISSFSSDLSEVNARFVNLKFVNNKEFIFFSNYNSPKSKEFKSHAQITALIFWNSINVQIRMKALVVKTSKAFNQEYFKEETKLKMLLQYLQINQFKLNHMRTLLRTIMILLNLQI